MRDALLRDIAESDFARQKSLEVITSYDVRLPPPGHVPQAIAVHPEDDVWEIWRNCMVDSDAICLVAPETEGVLSRLTEMAEALNRSGQNKMLLGCALESIKVTTSKFQTFRALRDAGIATLPAYWFADWQLLDFSLHPTNSWVAKLDDGAGCTDSACFESAAALAEWMQQGRTQTHIIQPYQPGIPASLSLLCKQGQAWLLSCNRQKIQVQKNGCTAAAFSFSGSTLNGLAQHWEAFDKIAQQVAAAFPGLCGYVGVDVIMSSSHQIHVLEINPRLTTSYAGLRSALGCNPANLILNLFYNAHFQLPQNLARNVVEVSL